MENRRQDYRHSLLPETCLPVELTCGSRLQPLVGIAVNLSVGGIAVQLAPKTLELQTSDRCAARIVLPDGEIELNMPALVVHKTVDRESPVYGLQFLPVVKAAENDFREKAVGRFLLEDQRRQRRQRVVIGAN